MPLKMNPITLLSCHNKILHLSVVKMACQYDNNAFDYFSLLILVPLRFNPILEGILNC